MKWWHLYLAILGFSCFLALVITPLCQKLAVLTGFMDKPAEQLHKQHSKATPLLGGLAIFSAWLITILVGTFSPQMISLEKLAPSVIPHIPGMVSVSGKMMVILAGALMAMALGLYDDKFNMSAKTKLIGQIVIAAFVVSLGGVKISMFIDNAVFSWCVSVFWILLIMNAINFFDNMDGLAVGTSAICLCFLTLAAAVNEQYFVAALAASAAGAAIGFWFYNHSPAAIFMGDSGSHFLGYILAVVSSQITYYQADISTTRFPILFPAFILAIPLFDTAAVVTIRLWKRRPIYIGDHNHISHRFVDMGMTRKKAVFLVHLLVWLICLSALPLLWGDERTTFVSLAQTLSILLLVSILQHSVIKAFREKSESENGSAEEADTSTEKAK